MLILNCRDPQDVPTVHFQIQLLFHGLPLTWVIIMLTANNIFLLECLSSLTLTSEQKMLLMWLTLLLFWLQVWQKARFVWCHHHAKHLQQCSSLRSVLAHLHCALLHAGHGSNSQLHSCVCIGYVFLIFIKLWPLTFILLSGCLILLFYYWSQWNLIDGQNNSMSKQMRTHLKFHLRLFGPYIYTKPVLSRHLRTFPECWQMLVKLSQTWLMYFYLWSHHYFILFVQSAETEIHWLYFLSTHFLHRLRDPDWFAQSSLLQLVLAIFLRA